MRLHLWGVFLLVTLLTACSPTVADSGNGRPAWLDVELTDVRTGETFTLGGFEGQTVMVETMAVWCPNCIQQQDQMGSALFELGDGVVGVSLDIDPGETADIVQQHADQFGREWHFALASPELSAMLQEEFGPQILAPTATPVFFIGPDGQVELTPFGLKGWDYLVATAESLQ